MRDLVHKMFLRSDLRRDATWVARALLGHFLVMHHGEEGNEVGGWVVETEAYHAHDPASHSFKGPTTRNRSMFGPAGSAYVYLICGIHECVNVVCEPEGIGAAVLIRAVEPRWGLESMRQRRRLKHDAAASLLASGPGKVCQALGISRAQDGLPLCDASSSLQLWRNPHRLRDVRHRGGIHVSPRIGITKAADWPLRFFLPGSSSVSR